VSAALLCFLISNVAGLSAPLIIKLLIDDALIHANMKALHVIILGVVFLYLLRGIFSFIHGYTIAKASNLMVCNFRQAMYAKLQRLDYAYFVNTPAGEIISLFTNDMLLLQQAVSLSIPDLLVESLNVLAIMVIMVYFDWHLALVTFATLPFIILAIGFFNRKIANLGMLVEHALAKVTTVLHQSLLTVMTVQSYGREEYEYKKFSAHIHKAAKDFIKVQRMNAILLSSVEFLGAIALTIIIWYGGREVIDGQLSIGGMFAFLVYIINIPMPIRKISKAVSQMRLGMVAWQRISTLERQPTRIVDGTKSLKTVNGVVEFREVSFEYLPHLGTLQNISVKAEPGQVVAIVGPSGAGKSSFANLLLRFYDPIRGGIFLDDVNIRELKINDLRRQIGFIQQEPILFNDSICENIRYGNPSAGMDEVVNAAKLANAHDFIQEMPGGYEYVVGELGGNLSGGQRQRIAVARAILLDPPILLLDEPTAALDAQAEKQVMDAVRQAGAGRTTFIITHRLSTLAGSDKVIYLNRGRILEVGTHDELMLRGGVYATAVKSQEFRE
jgi:subfamily B ATP-binding cassette protein MsbA